MWSVSFFFFIVFIDVDVFADWSPHGGYEWTFRVPKNALLVTLHSNNAGDWKKAREEAVVKPFAGDVKSYAGYFTVNKEYHSNMYFWFFPCEKEAEKKPVILWVHGGPSESSMTALFEENGPYKLVNGEVTLRETSWTKHYNVLYIDNPVGAGFSYTLHGGGYSQHIYEEAANLYKCLTQFYKMFPEYEKNAFYMAGQSFGGKVIPVLANLIHMKNNMTNSQKINLSGMMIGGGGLSPVDQVAWGEYLYEYGLLDQRDRDYMTNEENRARLYLDSGNLYDALWRLRRIQQKMRYIGYNIPLDLGDPHINMSCYDDVREFVTREDVREEIHVGDARLYDRKLVYWYLEYEIYKLVHFELSRVVQLGYKVLLYSGQFDMVTPPQQMDRVIASLHWQNKENFYKAKKQPWYSHGELAGFRKSYANLHQVFVRKANHMIVRSQQKWMLDLLKSFAV